MHISKNIGSFIFAMSLTVLFIPLHLASILLSAIISGIPDSLIFSLLIWWLFHLSFWTSLLIAVIIRLLFALIIRFRLTKQSLTTQFFSYYDGHRFSDVITKYKKEDERPYVSPRIDVKNSAFSVIEFGTYLDPRQTEKIKGFIVLDYDTGNIIKDDVELKNVLRVYQCWRYMYLNPILGNVAEPKELQFLKRWIVFEKRFKEQIESRKKDAYQKVSDVKDEQFVNILKSLDDEVIQQYPYFTKKLELEIELFTSIYDIFTKPSLEFYQKIMSDIDKISALGQEENKIWKKRLETWEKLYLHKLLKISDMPEPSLQGAKIGLVGDLIDYFILKQQLLPVGGATIAGFTFEGSKKVKKGTLRILNRYFTYHLAGIKAINKNIELNDKLRSINHNYKNIWNNVDLTKIRN